MYCLHIRFWGAPAKSEFFADENGEIYQKKK